ncbi:hypothetical protein PR048_029247 [Dryococelus australis]|uniref:Uncharacterized protein n=1 Tax=Dryococelus australis TaxID=614101 RepID=A0ABQ9GCV7_9NEOP|nr:hypothetical protein PR048_029247 [Dryococelus australis]
MRSGDVCRTSRSRALLDLRQTGQQLEGQLTNLQLTYGANFRMKKKWQAMIGSILFCKGAQNTVSEWLKVYLSKGLMV